MDVSLPCSTVERPGLEPYPAPFSGSYLRPSGAVDLRRLAEGVVALGLVLLVLYNVAWLLTWRDRGPLDLGAFLHSGASYARGLDPYRVHAGVLPPAESNTVNLNPPVSVHVFALLARLTPEHLDAVRNAVLVASVAVLGLAVALVARSRSWRSGALPLLAIAGSGAVWHTLVFGQIYAPLVLIATAAWLCLRRGDYLLAGACLGLLVAFKPNFLIWPALLFLAGQRRTAVVAGLGAAAVSLVPLLVDGPGIYGQWLAATLDSGQVYGTSNTSLLALAQRFGVEQAGLPLTALLVLFAAAWCWRSRPAPLEASALAVLAILLVGPLSWVGYTLFLLPYLLSRPWRGREWAFAMLIAAPYPIVTEINLGGDALARVTIGSAYAWAVLLVFGAFVLEQARRPALQSRARAPGFERNRLAAAVLEAAP